MALACRYLFGTVASAILLVLAMPLGEQFYLGWVALVPALIACRSSKFTIGFVSGIGTTLLAAWLSTRGWLYRGPHIAGNEAWVYTGFGIFGFALAISVGVWADRGTLAKPSWWFAAVATLAEALILFELPAHLALTQYRQPAVLLFAWIGGVWLVSFLLWWANFAIAKLPLPRFALAAGGLILLSIAASSVHFPVASDRQTVAAIQIAEPDEKQLSAMQKGASSKGAVLTVWPEFSGIPFAPGGSTTALRHLSEHGSPLVTTFEDDARPLPHNVSALFADGRELGRYSKRKLFGAETKMHQAGDRAVAIEYSGGKVGLEICYDSTFPAVNRETASLDANLIVVPSIDPDSTNDFMSAMHGAYTPFRAAEEGVSYVKADGLAYSMIVDPWGQIVAEAPPGDRLLVGSVPRAIRKAGPYRFGGDWFLWLCGILVVYGVWPRRKRAADNEADAKTVPSSAGDI